jgi:hypothetical protein
LANQDVVLYLKKSFMTVTGEGRGVVAGCDEMYSYLVRGGREYIHTYIQLLDRKNLLEKSLGRLSSRGAYTISVLRKYFAGTRVIG